MMPGPELIPQSRVERTIKDHDRREFSLFLGAGASRSSSVPLASEMIKEWRREAFCEHHPDTEASAQEIDDWCAGEPWYEADNEYSVLFETLYVNASSRQKYIEKHIKDAVPGWGYLYLANIVRNGYFNITYTTNFDDLINEGLSVYLGYNPVVCAADSVVDSINPTTDRVKIIKLHGDYLFERLKNTEEELARLDSNMEKKFREFSRHRGLVVLGYAGRDESVMSVIEALLAEEDRYFPTGVFWGIREDDQPAPRVAALREQHPDRFHLFSCNDFDGFMAGLHSLLQLDLPESIREPYEELRRKFEALTKTQVAAGEQDKTISEHRRLLEGQLELPWAKAEGSPKLVLLEAQLLLARRKHDQAIPKIEEYIEKQPDDPDALTTWGAALAMRSEDTGDSAAMDEAVDQWQRAAQLDAESILPRRSLAGYYMLNRQTDQAIEQCEELLELSANDRNLRLNLARLYFDAHRHEEALRQADVLLELEPGNPQLCAFRAEVLAAIGLLEEAIEQAALAVELDPGNAWFRTGYGQLLFQGMRFGEAEQEFRTAMQLDPRNPNPLHRLCILLASTFRTQEMKVAMADLQRLSPALAQSLELQMKRQRTAQMQAGVERVQAGVEQVKNWWKNI